MAYDFYTIGYENLGFSDFADFLTLNKIKHIIDVREYPKSRKKGFSKNEMANYFESNGVVYHHIRELGSPSELRKKVRKDRDYKHFFREYQDYLATQETALEEISNIAKSGTTCIFCYEEDINQCHRKTISQYLNILNNEDFNIIHLHNVQH